MLGIVFVAAALITLLVRPSGYPWVLSAAVAFPTSAAFSIGENAVSPFYLLALGAIVWLPVSKRRVKGPGQLALWLFVAWAILITLIGPFVFRGMPVLTPRGGLDGQVFDPSPLVPSVSNLAQIAYLLVACGVVYYLSTMRANPHLPALGLALGTALSSMNLLMTKVGATFPHEIFDTSNATYVSSSFDGQARLRGVFSEPSLLAEFSIAGVAFFFFMALQTQGRLRAMYFVLLVAAGMNMMSSASGTAVISAGVLSILIAIHLLRRFVASSARGAPAATLIVLGAVVGGIALGDQLVNTIETLVLNKASSGSAMIRSTADQIAVQIFGDSYGLGVGLGSNRPSSFLLMLLSCVGLVGVVALAAFITKILVRAGKSAPLQPAVWATVAALIAKTVAIPDLSSPYLWLLIGTCATAVWTIQGKAALPGRASVPAGGVVIERSAATAERFTPPDAMRKKADSETRDQLTTPMTRLDRDLL